MPEEVTGARAVQKAWLDFTNQFVNEEGQMSMTDAQVKQASMILFAQAYPMLLAYLVSLEDVVRAIDVVVANQQQIMGQILEQISNQVNVSTQVLDEQVRKLSKSIDTLVKSKGDTK